MKFPPRSNTAFGRFVRSHRRAKEITIEKLAQQAGLDRARLSRIERGDLHPPKLPKVIKIAQALGFREGSTEWNNLINLAVSNKVQMPVTVTTPELKLKNAGVGACKVCRNPMKIINNTFMICADCLSIFVTEALSYFRDKTEL